MSTNWIKNPENVNGKLKDLKINGTQFSRVVHPHGCNEWSENVEHFINLINRRSLNENPFYLHTILVIFFFVIQKIYSRDAELMREKQKKKDEDAAAAKAAGK